MTKSGNANPQRTCLGCKTVLDREAMVRYVLSPEQRVVVDYRKRLPGRGAYTCVSRQCLNEAIRRQQFTRTFRRQVDVCSGEELLGELQRQLRERILGLLGMARKSQQIISGSSLVLDNLSAENAVAFILLALDVSDGISAKVTGRADNKAIAWYRMFDKELYGQVLGKGERSVLALRPGALAMAIRLELERYQHIAGEQ